MAAVSLLVRARLRHRWRASLSLQRDAGVRIGTVIHVPLYATGQRGALLSGGNIRPAGPAATLRVVGIDVTESDFPGAGTPAFCGS